MDSAKRLLSLIFFIALVFFIAKLYFNYLISPVDTTNANKKTFVVSRGESVRQLSQRLQEQALIRSARVFNLLAKYKNQGFLIQAGEFKLSQDMNSEAILQQLTSASNDKWVTLIEGWRVEEMAQKLNQELEVDSKGFIKAAKEGYMFPDTYLFNKDMTVLMIISTLRDNFNRKFDSDLQVKVRNLGLTVDQTVILSSIVEREARSDVVRGMVGSILLKRLKIGMALNADATIQYALGYQKGENSWWKKSLSSDDLKVDSVYNTYLYPGLPPAPICNPSLSSLKAVVSADPTTPYLYYYHDSKGNSYYAKTLDEHNQNVSDHP